MTFHVWKTLFSWWFSITMGLLKPSFPYVQAEWDISNILVCKHSRIYCGKKIGPLEWNYKKEMTTACFIIPQMSSSIKPAVNLKGNIRSSWETCRVWIRTVYSVACKFCMISLERGVLHLAIHSKQFPASRTVQQVSFLHVVYMLWY